MRDSRSSSLARRALAVLAAGYLACLWLDAVGSHLPEALPAPAHFFVQAAQLFPRAVPEVTEFRVTGWRCATGRLEELDLQPYFPIHAGDKENRFDRALFFYLKERPVLQALERYLIDAEARLGADHAIGGVVILSLRRPVPAPGEAASTEERYRRVPLSEVPRSVTRKYWFVTAPEERERRCAERAGLPSP